VLALAYVPARTALRTSTASLCKALYPLDVLDDPTEILKAAESRQKIEQMAGADRSIFADFRAELVVFVPLLAGAVSSFLPP
jgi:hypothetical protein